MTPRTGFPTEAEAARIECDAFCEGRHVVPCYRAYGDKWDGGDGTCAASHAPGFNCRMAGKAAITLNRGRLAESQRAEPGKSFTIRLPPRRPDLKIIDTPE